MQVQQLQNSPMQQIYPAADPPLWRHFCNTAVVTHTETGHMFNAIHRYHFTINCESFLVRLLQFIVDTTAGNFSPFQKGKGAIGIHSQVE